jgi:pyruvate-formate lyase-activating enzyme
MNKDTIRLILFLGCNLKCKYCCNEQTQFNSQFVEKYFEDIDFTKYSNICISGGEPFLYKNILYDVLDNIEVVAAHCNIYIYSNGLLIGDSDMHILERYNIRAFNIGLHSLNQISKIIAVEKHFNTRFMINEKLYEKALLKYPERLNTENTKPWILNQCNRPNEDWILLK